MPKVRDTAALSEGDQTWLGSTRGIRTNRTGKLNPSNFTAPNGYIPSGTPVALDGATGELIPYAAGANEVQTLDLGAATAGTITITFDGETTEAIAYNATAATVQTALEALSNVGPGDAVVSGGPLPGGISLSFGGDYAGENVPEITVTPSGLTGGTVTVATTTQGGTSTAGSDELEGFIFTDQAVEAGQTEIQNVPLMDHGRVRTSRLPVAFTRPAPENDHTTVVYDLT